MELVHKNEKRVEQISSFMKELLDKRSLLTKSQIYEKYKEIINQIEPIDLFYLDMYKEDTNLSIDDIKENAGKFVNVFYNALSKYEPASFDSNLFTYFVKENREIELKLDQMKPLFKQSNIIENLDEIIKGFEQLYILERKFVKRENILWPSIEEKLPSTMPLKVMWSLHDDARTLLKDIIDGLKSNTPNVSNIIYMIGEYYYLIYGINQKEEIILFPIANQLLKTKEKEILYSETLEYGYCFIDDLPKPKSIEEKVSYTEGMFETKTGKLSMKEIDNVFRFLPLDITFVDVNDKVKYFNDRPQRHFPRNPSIIGRLVKFCHPPKSVEVVEKIIDAFKKGEKDFAEFWIEFRGVFLYITYYAVRDKNDVYMGVLEVSQDVTRIRSLEGQQRLLDWN